MMQVEINEEFQTKPIQILDRESHGIVEMNHYASEGIVKTWLIEAT